jgi:hypothetical protein
MIVAILNEAVRRALKSLNMERTALSNESQDCGVSIPSFSVNLLQNQGDSGSIAHSTGWNATASELVC